MMEQREREGPSRLAPLDRAMNTDSNSLAVSAGLRAALGYYRLVAEIGRGGMASVFLSLFPNGDGTSRKVVLKQLHPELSMDDDFRAMFEDEARLATRLHHENVVETYDIYSDTDLCVLVMEFLDGQTLSRVRQRARKLSNVPLSIQLRAMAEVLAGLHYVHELTDESGRPLGIVHRDVTPSNVFITYDGRVKVVDFGIAKATSRIAETRMGVLKGKLAYMSPEAVRGEPVDRRSDIFSVGVILWEAATGMRLWQDHDEVAIYRRLATGDLPVHPTGVQIANEELFRIATRALSVDPYQRYDNAEEMKLQIENLLVQLGKVTRAPAVSAYMESFFAVEREQFQNIVDDALAKFPTKPVSQRRLLANELTASYPALDPAEPPTTVSTTSGGTFRTTTFDVAGEDNDVPDFRPRRHGFLVAAGAAALAVGVAYGAHAPSGFDNNPVWSAMHGSPKRAAAAERMAIPSAPVANAMALHQAPVAPQTPVAPQAPVTAAPSVAMPPAPTPPPYEKAPAPVAAQSALSAMPPVDVQAPALISVALWAHPAEARFFIDGEAVDGNPVSFQRRSDDKKHRIRVEAPGYATIWRPVDFDRDVTREFELVPFATQPATAPAARPGEPREEPGSLPKPRRTKRSLDRDDPWGL